MGVDLNIVEWVLKLNKPLHGIKQESANWLDLIKNGLKIRGYHKYQVDPFVFYRKYSVILTYVDYCVIVSHKQEKITPSIESLNNYPEHVGLTMSCVSNQYRCLLENH